MAIKHNTHLFHLLLSILRSPTMLLSLPITNQTQRPPNLLDLLPKRSITRRFRRQAFILQVLQKPVISLEMPLRNKKSTNSRIPRINFILLQTNPPQLLHTLHHLPTPPLRKRLQHNLRDHRTQILNRLAHHITLR